MTRSQQRGDKRKRSGASENGQGGQRKRQWRSADTNWTGHGIFMTCPRGKERKAANEFIEILTETAASLYPHLNLSELPLPPKPVKPPEKTAESEDDDDLRNGPADRAAAETGSAFAQASSSTSPPSHSGNGKCDQNEHGDEVNTDAPVSPAQIAEGGDIEAELRAELASLRQAGSKTFGKQRLPPSSSRGPEGREKPSTAPPFRLMETGTECLVLIGVHHQLDPFELCDTFLTEVERTGEARSRIISRLSPVAGLCLANHQELHLFAQRVLPAHFPEDQAGTFKIDPRIRSHNTLNRSHVIEIVASAIPRSPGGGGWRADLKQADKWIVVEIHKAQAGIGILSNYLRFCKMNPLELANSVKTKRHEEQQQQQQKQQQQRRGELNAHGEKRVSPVTGHGEGIEETKEVEVPESATAAPHLAGKESE